MDIPSNYNLAMEAAQALYATRENNRGSILIALCAYAHFRYKDPIPSETLRLSANVMFRAVRLIGMDETPQSADVAGMALSALWHIATDEEKETARRLLSAKSMLSAHTDTARTGASGSESAEDGA